VPVECSRHPLRPPGAGRPRHIDELIPAFHPHLRRRPRGHRSGPERLSEPSTSRAATDSAAREPRGLDVASWHLPPWIAGIRHLSRAPWLSVTESGAEVSGHISPLRRRPYELGRL